jgi:hypothetical protein
MPGNELRQPTAARVQQAYQPPTSRGIDAIKEDADMSDAELQVLALTSS